MKTSAEFRLFWLALRRPQRDEDAAALREAIATTPRWDTVLEGARRHGVAALLLAGLQDCGAAVPEPILAGLQRIAARTARRSLVQATALAELSRRFAEAGLPMLALKGVPLSLQLYGDLGLRSARDIDIIVDSANADAAETLLTKAGHSPVGGTFSGHQKQLYRRWFKEVKYTHPAHGLVELHHRLSDLPELMPWDFSTLWREHEEVPVRGVPVAVPGRRHLALYLCAHGAEHAWERLRWLTDIAALLRAPKSAEAALATADEAGLAAPMLQALTLAHDWLALPVAEPVLARARSDQRVARLDRILAHFYKDEAWHQMPRRGSPAALMRYSLWLRLYRMCIKPEWRYRLRRLRRDLLSPADWAAVPLPDRLFWLYPLIRPFGWLLRRRSD
jgi:hypothetical protein